MIFRETYLAVKTHHRAYPEEITYKFVPRKVKIVQFDGKKFYTE
jgi:hypothetical protein